jgi:quinol monooxygenase YgiN
MNRFLATLSLGLFAASLLPAQMGDYLDIYVAQVKPEKRADFDAISRKIAEANRKSKGDKWLAMENTYGTQDVVSFVSHRKDYASIDEASKTFMSALNEALGPAGVKKLFQDFGNTVVSTRTELRRRRWDLSMNAPKDDEAYAKLVGAARWIRTLEVHVKPGHEAEFAEQAKQVKAAYESGASSWAVLASQTVAGDRGGTFYFTSLQPSLAGFDSAPDLRKLMGDEAFASWEKSTADTVVFSETRLMRFVPELSNPPEDIVQNAPDFWKPKPATAMSPKPKPAPAAKTTQ